MSEIKSLKESLGEQPFINPRNQKWFEQAVADIKNNRKKFKEEFDKNFNEKGKVTGMYKVTSGKFKGCCYSYLPEEIRAAEKEIIEDKIYEEEKVKLSKQEFTWGEE